MSILHLILKYDEIYQCQNRIEECKKKIRAEVEDIQIYKQKLDEAFNQYIKQWQ